MAAKTLWCPSCATNVKSDSSASTHRMPPYATVNGKRGSMHDPIIRTEFIDYDARRTPKTKRFCVKCQKDLDPRKAVRRVFVTEGMHAVHPDDVACYTPKKSDPGWLLIGFDCARALGMEWSVAETN
jgi:hypothetical protein